MYTLNSLLNNWVDSDDFNHLTRDLRSSKYNQLLVQGLEGVQRDFLMAGLTAKTDYLNYGIVVPHLERAEELAAHLEAFLPREEVLVVPPRDMVLAEEVMAQSKEIQERRFKALERLVHKERVLLIIPIAALMQRMQPLESWRKAVWELEAGSFCDREKLLAGLSAGGYSRSSLVESKGEFSARGYIVDLFPLGRDYPLRLEFFDNQLESIREFDPSSQRSKGPLERVKVLPASEVVLEEKRRQEGLNLIKETLNTTEEKLKKRGKKEQADKLRAKLEKQLPALERPVLNEGLWGYFTFFYQEGATWLDYLAASGLAIWDDSVKIKENAQQHYRRWEEQRTELIAQGQLLSQEMSLIWSLEELRQRNPFPALYLNSFLSREKEVRFEQKYHLEGRELPTFYGQWDLIKEEIEHWKDSGYRVFILADSQERGHHLLETCRKMEIPVFNGLDREQVHPDLPTPALIEGRLNRGMVLSPIKTVLITEKDILPRQKRAGPSKKKKKTQGEGLRDWRELKIGDFIVHEQHGVGEYLGVQTLEVDGAHQDYLHLRYAGGDKLYLPTEQIHLIQKYVGVEGKKPRLHRMGSGEWNKIKKKVKKSVEELARELLSIYTARKSIDGHAFSPDHPWQQEFEAQFPYEETSDQKKAIEEVKKDMERSHPMDRLICGDVGYGKTEVALRAAFKAIMDGKQVAVLVPTTVLAHQHYNTFKERFQQFPVRVELLSRFLSRSRQKEVIRGIRQGTVDLVIGTHRLLSKDISFSDLGLVVIDEEHRFGVRHKERLKRLRLDTDVLTMTATPIPRTLHMSLAGSRDLSLIETPPENRYPVQTYLMEYHDELLRESISREISRGGQVYFVYNRVEDIEKWVMKVKDLVPRARVALAHGQMSEAQLERIMTEFLEGHYDVLVSTTIIEAGLDISNVNTILIYHADRFGLAQLYQLRGRVGRTDRVAYAYLTYHPEKTLNEEAEKRLQAVKELAELGSGYKIALRDLEIRGAGNLLGPEQHGFMLSVGFDLYCQLLEEAVQEVKGEEQPKQPAQPRIELNVSAFIPSSYIPDADQKVQIYQRINRSEELADLTEMKEEMQDRFGTVPLEVNNLLGVARLRILARQLGVESIQQEHRQLTLTFSSREKHREEELLSLWKQVPGKVVSSRSGQIYVSYRLLQGEFPLEEIEGLFYQILELVGQDVS